MVGKSELQRVKDKKKQKGFKTPTNQAILFSKTVFNSLANEVTQRTMKKAIENFIGRIIVGLVKIFIDLFLASLLIFATTILAVASLLCLALDWVTAAIVFGIALLSLTLVARSHCWSRRPGDL